MPLHHPKHRHHDDDLLPYRRSDDEAKPRRPYTPTFPSSPASANRLLLFFAVACLVLAAASFAFAVSTSRNRQPLPQPPPTVAFRCGRAEDSLRSFLAASSHGNFSAGDREKVLAVVGVHTEHGNFSAARRAALRATWFPPNPEGIVRFCTLP